MTKPLSLSLVLCRVHWQFARVGRLDSFACQLLRPLRDRESRRLGAARSTTGRRELQRIQNLRAEHVYIVSREDDPQTAANDR